MLPALADPQLALEPGAPQLHPGGNLCAELRLGHGDIARGFAVDYPVLLLDEPTASLDAGNRALVVGLIQEAKARGAAVVGIFHDDEVRAAVADRLFDLARERSAA